MLPVSTPKSVVTSRTSVLLQVRPPSSLEASQSWLSGNCDEPADCLRAAAPTVS